jgi:biopolymer transport protein ExbD
MSFLDDRNLQDKGNFNFAPMLDFLFIMLMFFASLAVSRIIAKDTDIDLVHIEPEKISTDSLQGEEEYKLITINIAEDGTYKWVTGVRDHEMASADAISQELKSQYQKGTLPKNKELTHVLLRIDKKTQWEPVLKVIFAIRDAGFEVHPVYEPESSPSVAVNVSRP